MCGCLLGFGARWRYYKQCLIVDQKVAVQVPDSCAHNHILVLYSTTAQLLVIQPLFLKIVGWYRGIRCKLADI